MAITLAELRKRAENDRKDAERRLADTDAAVRRLLAASEADGVDTLPPDQATRAEALIKAKRAARDDISRAEVTLDTCRVAEDELAREVAAQRQSYPTAAAAMLHGTPGEYRAGSPGLPPSGGSDPQWVRRGDGRPGAVER